MRVNAFLQLTPTFLRYADTTVGADATLQITAARQVDARGRAASGLCSFLFCFV